MIIKHVLGYICIGLFFLGTPLSLHAGKSEPNQGNAPACTASPCQSPMVPQSFAFDKENRLFVSICNLENTVDIIRYENGELQKDAFFQVDIVDGRHDVDYIYRPQSVAVYDGYIVVLASHVDSCFLAVLNPQGELLQQFFFKGSASVFSYEPTSHELYIAGESNVGYNIAVVNTSAGFDKLQINPDLNFHYDLPKKADKIKSIDPYGLYLTIISVSVVLCSLLVLFLCFKLLGIILLAIQKKRAQKSQAHTPDGGMTARSAVEDTSGSDYAAIAAAIWMYQNEMHDDESNILTIEKIARNYSPWSSKIHNMNTYFLHQNRR